LGRSATDLSNRCVRCRLRRDLCLCGEVVPLVTRTRVVVLRHALEAFRSTNTGRIALLALARGELETYGAPGGDGPGPADLEGAWLLFPDGARTPEAPPRTLVAVDGSWSQARRMVQQVPWLRVLPRMALPPGPALPRLRVAPRPDGLSTIEAITRGLARYEAPEVTEGLERLCRLHAERTRAARGGRTPRK
jgi:DTW domain-containing protein YfiP